MTLEGWQRGIQFMRHQASPSVTSVDLPVSHPGFWLARLKRCIDLIGSCIALIFLLPVFISVIVAIRLETEGPALFRQWRVGRAGRHFEVVKFRTMYFQWCDANGERQNRPRDTRVTRVGRFLRRTSIDELPQLFNVLRGDMSLVGPRPHPVHMKVGERYYSDIIPEYHERHLIRPGITGWAQINGSRGRIHEIGGARRRVELDLFYINNISILLDLRIIFRTICGGFIATDE